MEDGNRDEITVSSMEELKELIRALPDDIVLSVAMGEAERNGEKERI